MPDPIARVQRALRAWMQGVLLLDGHALRARFVIDPVTGQPLLPIAGSGHDGTFDACLAVPDDGTDNLPGDRVVLFGEVTPVSESHLSIARVEAMLGSLKGLDLRPANLTVCSMRISLAKIDDESVEGEDICRPSTLAHDAGAELRLCALANVRPEALRQAMNSTADTLRAIAVDTWGLYARASFGIAFKPFDEPARDEAHAREMLIGWGL